MDTLMVGQEVLINQGDGWVKGVVTKITPDGLEVQTRPPWSAPSRLVYFDNNGRQCHRPGLPCLGIEIGGNSYVPWELDSADSALMTEYRRAGRGESWTRGS